MGCFSSVNPNEKFENAQNAIFIRDAMTFGIFNTPEPSFLHIEYLKEFLVILPGGKHDTRNDSQRLRRDRKVG